MCSWCHKFIVVQTLNRQVKIHTIYILDTQSAQILQKLDGHFGTWCMSSARSFLIVYKNLLARFVQGVLYWENGGVPPPTKSLLIHPLPTKFLFPPTESQFNLIKNKNILFSCIHCSCTIFVLISYSFKT